MIRQGITLNQYLWQQQVYLNIPTKLAILLVQIGFAAKTLSCEKDASAVVSKLERVGEKKATGKAQTKFDAFSNETVMEAFSKTKLVAALASKQLTQFEYIEGGSDCDYILRISRINDSSTRDGDNSVGTIFAIYQVITSSSYCILGQEMQRSMAELITAGYICYGTSTVLVYAYDNRVDGFTLDANKGEFLLTHPDIRCPTQGQSYCANLSHYREWHLQIQQFVNYLNDYHSATNRPYSMHFTGVMLADIHHTLLEGGIYFEPSNAYHKNGKLCLLSECVPLAFIFKQAGGRASNGQEQILDIPVESIHQRSPLVIGSQADVLLYEQFLTDSRW